MPDQLLTPSKISAFLDCAHYLTLRDRVDAGQVEVGGGAGSLAQLLMVKGLQHEQECLQYYRNQGLTVYEVPERRSTENFAQWTARVGNPLADGYDVVYQMPFIHDGMRGVADFLVRTPTEGGDYVYEPLDAKLARQSAKPAHVLQLCFYADALQALTGKAPEKLYIWLGSGRIESVRRESVQAYWRRLRTQLAKVLATPVEAEAEIATEPEPCAHCQFCEFAEVCEQDWRNDDSLVFVANILKPERVALVARGDDTMASLAEVTEAVDGIRPERLERLIAQADLQVRARHEPDELPPLRELPIAEDSIDGFKALPEPDDGDVFLDYEGHPFWKPDTGLFFMAGILARDELGEWRYEARWAHDRTEEAQLFEDLVEWLADRRTRFPGMHVYHYNHTERSSLERLVAEHDLSDAKVYEFVSSGLFVDLLAIIRKAMQIGIESYSLKQVEKLAGFDREDDLESGAGAVVEYDRYCHTGDPEALALIAEYNEDDVRATLAVRDWLVRKRPTDIEWRTPRLEPPEPSLDINAQVEALKAYPPESPQHLLGDLLGYWQREARVYFGQLMVKCAFETVVQLDSPDIIGGLVFEEFLTKPGKRDERARFRIPAQDLHPDVMRGGACVYAIDAEQCGYASFDRIEPDAEFVDVVWGDACKEAGVMPQALVLNEWVAVKPKDASLVQLANRVIDRETDTSDICLAMKLLCNEAPRLQGDAVSGFGDTVDEMKQWIARIDNSFIPIQGPPGTGKTYSGAHLIQELVLAGRRVGVTSNSHAAIDNLMRETAKRFKEDGNISKLCAIQKVRSKRDSVPGIDYATGSSKKFFQDQFNVVAGTTWLFANQQMQSRIDTLIVDEAGQLSLADVIACVQSTKNIVLLGDPQQLAHVSQAVHPNDSGVSVLTHVLRDHPTVTPDRGVFLSETRRMHPDVCNFISSQFYDGRLNSYSDCATQSTTLGTGLRWVQARHSGCSTSSDEEAGLVADLVKRLLGEKWTDKHGQERAMTTSDVLVVAPYNDQVNLLHETLDSEPVTTGVRVGTVDKFQGQEAPVVIFSMASSTGEDIPRGVEFLFSKNRLNVAISRAKCLAYLVCTDELLNTRARTIEEMELISAVNAFVEQAEAV